MSMSTKWMSWAEMRGISICLYWLIFFFNKACYVLKFKQGGPMLLTFKLHDPKHPSTNFSDQNSP